MANIATHSNAIPQARKLASEKSAVSIQARAVIDGAAAGTPQPRAGHGDQAGASQHRGGNRHAPATRACCSQ
jgi:hypothetical protein